MITNLVESLQLLHESTLGDINTSMPGEVVSYDAARNRAVVRPVLPKALNSEEALEPPKIVEVPVVWPASNGGKSSFTMPLQPGDGVMLSFQQRSLEGWLDGKKEMPDDPRQFDLSDCVAHPGLSHSGTVAHSDDVVLKFNNSEVRIKPDGTILLGNASGGITIDSGGKMTLKATSIHVETSAKSFTLETHKHDKVQFGGSLSGEPFPGSLE
jgi:hypothetical protein